MQSNIGENRITELFGNSTGKRIAVIGDVMLDQYYWGSVSRVSPEAPVPVVEVNSESIRLGGAANVANNIASLGAEPFLIGVVGNDRNGELLTSLLLDAGFPSEGLYVDSSRPTTIKTRVIAHSQHVVRFDRESTADLDAPAERRLVDILQNNIDGIDGIILQDYNKGIFTRNVISEVIRLSRDHNKLLTVDPKFKNFFEYRDVTVFKPNRRELEQAFGVKLHTTGDFDRYGRELLHMIRAESVLITRGEHGMMLFEKSGVVHHVPTRTRSVADVSGAGDTVIATLTVMLTAGAGIGEASAIANFAGGVVCEDIGIVPIDPVRLKETMLRFERDDSEVGTKESVRYG